LTGSWKALVKRRRRLRQQYLEYRSLAPLRAGWLNDRNGAETVSSSSTDDRQHTLKS